MRLSNEDKKIVDAFQALQKDGEKNQKLTRLNDEIKDKFIMTFDNNIVNFSNLKLNSWDL
jgi:hypothetical protein